MQLKQWFNFIGRGQIFYTNFHYYHTNNYICGKSVKRSIGSVSLASLQLCQLGGKERKKRRSVSFITFICSRNFLSHWHIEETLNFKIDCEERGSLVVFSLHRDERARGSGEEKRTGREKRMIKVLNKTILSGGWTVQK